MSDDDKSYVDGLEEHSELMTGKPATPDEITKNFALYGLSRRVDIIKDFRKSLDRDVDSDVASLKKYASDVNQLKRLEEMHARLRKAKR
ncbi:MULTISPECIES: hypothetical protein [Bradyrhizobium]|uniref:hypothetical protein n=1 Tax=Bradyrhizobium TaxID=374 RepID=UPI0020A1B9B8|nr:hypothetical protein [Bradyrhizobium elkanii]MCP1969905.1 hypothetical protein [Bradyrhizobium elkanii]MCS4108587.1 hypothetical protein [Bradyrhizobium elkanii]